MKPNAEAVILEILRHKEGRLITREQVVRESKYSSSTTRSALWRLRKKRLVVKHETTRKEISSFPYGPMVKSSRVVYWGAHTQEVSLGSQAEAEEGRQAQEVSQHGAEAFSTPNTMSTSAPLSLNDIPEDDE